MKKFIFLMLGIYSLAFAQQEEDLLQTAIKQNSTFKTKNAELGYQLLDVTARFATKMESQEKINESITNREFIYDTLLIEVVTPANCCASFECELEAKDAERINLKFTKEDQNCLCLKGIYLTYKILVKSRHDNIIELNGKQLEYRKHDPNESRDVTEYYDNGQVKSIKMYLGAELKRVSYFDENGKRTKMLMYNGGKVIEKNY